MENLININKGTSCVLSIMFYDKSDLLIQKRQLSSYNDCQWVPIPKDTSIDVARKYIIKIENIPNKFLSNNKLINNMLIHLRNDIASRATLKISKEGYKFIELSGNKIDLVIKRIKNDFGCSNNNIIVYGI
jgi:translation initiation factor 1 (eIF-1/SUI1)